MVPGGIRWEDNGGGGWKDVLREGQKNCGWVQGRDGPRGRGRTERWGWGGAERGPRGYRAGATKEVSRYEGAGDADENLCSGGPPQHDSSKASALGLLPPPGPPDQHPPPVLLLLLLLLLHSAPTTLHPPHT